MTVSRRPEYMPYLAMIQRCANPQAASYEKYGGRGISVHADWIGAGGFARFLEYIGPRPSNLHQIERIDSDGNYVPGNVKWADTREQARNRSSNKFIEFNGERLCEADWAKRLGISHQQFQRRLADWPLERALTQTRRSTGFSLQPEHYVRLANSPREWTLKPNWAAFRRLKPLLKAGLIEERCRDIAAPDSVSREIVDEWRITDAGATILKELGRDQ